MGRDERAFAHADESTARYGSVSAYIDVSHLKIIGALLVCIVWAVHKKSGSALWRCVCSPMSHPARCCWCELLECTVHIVDDKISQHNMDSPPCALATRPPVLRGPRGGAFVLPGAVGKILVGIALVLMVPISCRELVSASVAGQKASIDGMLGGSAWTSRS